MSKTKLLLVLMFTFLASEVTWGAETHKNPLEAASQYISDTTITAKVKYELLTDADINSSLFISVITNDGTVTLSGNVDTATQKEKAIQVTSRVNGVKFVNDKLVVNTE